MQLPPDLTEAIERENDPRRKSVRYLAIAFFVMGGVAVILHSAWFIATPVYLTEMSANCQAAYQKQVDALKAVNSTSTAKEVSCSYGYIGFGVWIGFSFILTGIILICPQNCCIHFIAAMLVMPLAIALLVLGILSMSNTDALYTAYISDKYGLTTATTTTTTSKSVVGGSTTTTTTTAASEVDALVDVRKYMQAETMISILLTTVGLIATPLTIYLFHIVILKWKKGDYSLSTTTTAR